MLPIYAGGHVVPVFPEVLGGRWGHAIPDLKPSPTFPESMRLRPPPPSPAQRFVASLSDSEILALMREVEEGKWHAGVSRRITHAMRAAGSWFDGHILPNPPPGDADPWEFSYLRAEFGIPNMVRQPIPNYTYSYYVDFQNGVDNSSNGRTFGTPTKSLYQAALNWIADGAPGNVVFYLRARQHYEYLSISSTGLSSATGSTIANISPFTKANCVNVTANNPLHIRTWPSDVAAGNMCEFVGTGIPSNYATSRNAHLPIQLTVDSDFARIIEMRFSAGAGNAIRVGWETAGVGSGNEVEDVQAINCHINHAHGDGFFSTRGNANVWFMTGMAHHCQSWFGAGGGNNTSGVKLATNQYGGIIDSIIFKCGDDNTDFLASSSMLLQRNAAWLAGHYWQDYTTGIGETWQNWTPFGLSEIHSSEGGNGNGYKMGTGTLANQSIARRNVAFWNATGGITDHGGHDYLIYNNSMYANDVHGYVMRARSWLANNLVFAQTASLIRDQGTYSDGPPYATKNHWKDIYGVGSGNSRSVGNLGRYPDGGVLDTHFVSITPGVGVMGFLQPKASTLAQGFGFSFANECQSTSGWSSVTLPGVMATVGYREAA